MVLKHLLMVHSTTVSSLTPLCTTANAVCATQGMTEKRTRLFYTEFATLCKPLQRQLAHLE